MLTSKQCALFYCVTFRISTTRVPFVIFVPKSDPFGQDGFETYNSKIKINSVGRNSKSNVLQLF